MLKNFKTIAGYGEGEITEKKSKFIGVVCTADTEEKARAFIEEQKKRHYTATHHVFAYQIGERNQIQRCSDDGEPQGTAGKPVLDVLIGEELKNTVIVVIRYFGGTLLGTGGLVRAYGKAAKEGILAAGIVKKILYGKYSVKVEYTLSGKIQYELLQKQFILLDTVYTEQVEYIVLVEPDKETEFLKTMTNLSSGKSTVEKLKELYGVWQKDKLSVEELL